MAKLPDNVKIEFRPSHEIEGCRWDEEAQLYRVTVDGRDYQSYRTAGQLRGIVQDRRRAAAAFEAMARCAEAREKAGTERRDRIRGEVMREVGYALATAEGYQNLGKANPHAQRLVDLAVEARLKLEGQA